VANNKPRKVLMRASRLHLTSANPGKIAHLINLFPMIDEKVNSCIDTLWQMDNIPSLLPKEITHIIGSPSERFNQVLGKQASACVRSIRGKQNKALFVLKRGLSLKKHQKEALTANKPTWVGCIELDQRFISIEPGNNSFDYWIHLHIPKTIDVLLPFNLTNYQKKLIKRGYDLKTAQLRLHRIGEIDLFFAQPTPEKKPVIQSEIIGIDVGRKKCITTSDGVVESTHSTGHEVDHILKKIGRQKWGSKNNKQSRNELINQINYSCKHDIDWHRTTMICIEDIKNLKNGKAMGTEGASWSYPRIRASLEMLAEEHGVHVRLVNPAYTSQTCSSCGEIHKESRRGEDYECISCGMSMDADVNAAINILRRGINSSSSPKTDNDCKKLRFQRLCA
jgi:putative transposase